MTDDVRRLVGGFATGTLTEKERQALFEAALHDDELFAALADEQALKDLLDDSSVRAQVLRATEEPRFSVTSALKEWFERPKAKILVATGVILMAVIGFKELQPRYEKVTEVAEVREPSLMERAPEPIAPPVSRPPAAQREPATRKQSAPAIREKAQEQRAEAIQEPPAMAKSQPSISTGVVGGVPPGPEMQMSSRQFELSDQARTVRAPAAATTVVPLQYQLLLREQDGEFRSVPNDYEFLPGDMIRVRVTSTRAGAVALSMAGQQTVVRAVQANQATSIPATGGIQIDAGITKLVLGFAVPGANRPAVSGFLDREEAKLKQEAVPPSFTIEIPIRHRSP